MNDKILTFNSIFAPSIDEYLAVKQQQNTNVRAIITVMKELDKLPLVRHIELPVITKEIFMQWKSLYAEMVIKTCDKHCWEEPEIEVSETANCRVVVNHVVELTAEEKEKARQDAINKLRDEEMAKMRRPKTTETKTQDVQPSLFDF